MCCRVFVSHKYYNDYTPIDLLTDWKSDHIDRSTQEEHNVL